jgi:menaquinol-cytochrome c reductase iron-sulfur subunit
MKPSSYSAPSHRASAVPPPEGPPRRNVVAAMFAVMIGGIVSLFPMAAGALVFFDPILRKKSNKAASPGAESHPYLRVASLDSIPADGTPVQVPVFSDLVDAWNREVNQPVGAVYLIRNGDEVKCFNAICPHAGCFVGYAGERDIFQCPCHTSSFQLDGTRIHPSPSPRDLDALPVDAAKLKEGQVWVQFKNFYPGKAAPEVKE